MPRIGRGYRAGVAVRAPAGAARVLIAAAGLLCLAQIGPASAPLARDVQRWLEPWIQLERQDLRALGAGDVVARTLPAEGGEIAVFIAGNVDIGPDAFAQAVQDPERLWASPRVPRVRRFSSPPRRADLDALRLPARDADAIDDCRPGDCDVKLTSREMRRLQQAESVDHEFRQVVFDRVAEYLESGLRGADDLHDHREPVDPLRIASGLLLRSPWLTERAPALAELVENFPRGRTRSPDSFLYWLETTYTPKPTIQVVHVILNRRAPADAASPDVLVVSRQVFASHYVNGSLSLSALFAGANGSPGHLAYVTRAHVDGIQGWPSGFRRMLVERAVRQRGAEAFEQQRRRLSS